MDWLNQGYGDFGTPKRCPSSLASLPRSRSMEHPSIVAVECKMGHPTKLFDRSKLGSRLWQVSESKSHGGGDEATTDAEDCPGSGGSNLSGFGLSGGGVSAGGSGARDDVQPLRDAWRVSAAGDPESVGEQQPDRFHGVVELCPCRSDGVPGDARDSCARGVGGCGSAFVDWDSVDRACTGEGEFGSGGGGSACAFEVRQHSVR